MTRALREAWSRRSLLAAAALFSVLAQGRCGAIGGRAGAPARPGAADPAVSPEPLPVEPLPISHRDFPKRPPGTLTFARDIAPLLHRHCAACHRPGGSAPFSLLTHEDVRKRGTEIATVTKMRFMPPWLPAPGHGDFLGRRGLSLEEIGLFQQWIFEGMALGDPADLPEMPSWPEGWELGEPDLVVGLPEPYDLPAEGTDVFRNFVLSDLVAEDRWVRGFEIRPSNPRVVHHATMQIDPTRASRRRDREEPGPGFAGMQLESSFMPDGHFLGWAPGRRAALLPETMSWRLPAEADLVLQLHLLPSGKPEAVRAEIGFHLADRPPAEVPWMIRLGTRVIDIPAGEREYVIHDTYPLPVDVQVLGMFPHAHYLARDMRGFATLPDGSKRWLLWVPEWDFSWQDDYRCSEPLFLPRGTVLGMRFTYDNSSSNLRNPHDPPRRVRFGGKTLDEMGDLWIQVLPRDRAGLEVLRADYIRFDRERNVARIRSLIEKDPEDPLRRNELGHHLMLAGRVDEAAAAFREALRLDPGFALGRRNLAVALFRQGAVREAVEELRKVVEVAPEDAEAHGHLGNILGSTGRYDEAMAHLRQALSLEPHLPQARYHLGLALERTGRPAEALDCYRRALGQEPGWALPLCAAAWLEATDPRVLDPVSAVRDAEQAAAMTRYREPIALEALGAAYGSAGRFAEAAASAEGALRLLPGGARNPRAKRILEALERYRGGAPYRSGANGGFGGSRSAPR